MGELCATPLSSQGKSSQVKSSRWDRRGRKKELGLEKGRKEGRKQTVDGTINCLMQVFNRYFMEWCDGVIF